MSRVGKKPIPIPEKIKVTYVDRVLTAKGEKGTLRRTIHSAVELQVEDGKVSVSCFKDDQSSRAFQGMTRSLINNMVIGVSKGFERTLEINGIGYRAELKGKQIVLSLGFSHLVEFDLPDGISANIEKNTTIKLSATIFPIVLAALHLLSGLSRLLNASSVLPHETRVRP